MKRPKKKRIQIKIMKKIIKKQQKKMMGIKKDIRAESQEVENWALWPNQITRIIKIIKIKKIKKRNKNKYIDKYNLSSSENRMF